MKLFFDIELLRESFLTAAAAIYEKRGLIKRNTSTSIFSFVMNVTCDKLSAYRINNMAHY